jgi:hypothetical protein
MRTFIGIDLGSTTTKSVLIDENLEVLGRGITNSRSNYDVAARVSKQEAKIAARFTLFRNALGKDAEHLLCTSKDFHWRFLAQVLRDLQVPQTLGDRCPPVLDAVFKSGGASPPGARAVDFHGLRDLHEPRGSQAGLPQTMLNI